MPEETDTFCRAPYLLPAFFGGAKHDLGVASVSTVSRTRFLADCNPAYGPEDRVVRAALVDALGSSSCATNRDERSRLRLILARDFSTEHEGIKTHGNGQRSGKLLTLILSGQCQTLLDSLFSGSAEDLSQVR